MLMDCVSRFDAHGSQFFAKFDLFIVLTSHLDAYILRYGDFCANNNDNNNDDDTTDYFTPCACVRGKNVVHAPYERKSNHPPPLKCSPTYAGIHGYTVRRKLELILVVSLFPSK